MRPWVHDDDDDGYRLSLEFAAAALAQVAGLIAMINWLIT